MQTRLKDGIVQPCIYPDFQCFATALTAITEAYTPVHFKAAASQQVWQYAMEEEIKALQLQGT